MQALKELHNDIQKALTSPARGKIELECRFRDIGSSTFSRVRESLSRFRNESSHLQDRISEGIRRSVKTSPDGHEVVSNTRKREIWSRIIEDYNIKIAVSDEESVPIQPGSPRPELVRTKD